MLEGFAHCRSLTRYTDLVTVLKGRTISEIQKTRLMMSFQKETNLDVEICVGGGSTHFHKGADITARCTLYGSSCSE